jgi:hypothetical protein
MIRKIIELLNTDDFYGKHELIDIAKGKYKAASNIKEAKELLKRRKNGIKR